LGLPDEPVGHSAGPVDAPDRGIGQFLVLPVGPFLPQQFLVAHDVEDVVGDLEGEPDVPPVDVQGFLFGGGGAGEDGPGEEAGAEQGGGLVEMDVVDRGLQPVRAQVGGLSLGHQVRGLAADHPLGSRRFRDQPDGPERGIRRNSRRDAGHEFESQGQQRVARQDRDPFAEHLVVGRFPSAEVVVVHRGKVVVDQRVGVDHLQRAGGRHHHRGLPPAEFGRHQAEDGPEPFPTGEDRITHGLVDDRRRNGGGREIPVERSVHEDLPFVQIGLKRLGHGSGSLSDISVGWP